MIPNTNEIRVFCRAHGCEWTPDAMRRAYEAIVKAWTAAGLPPDRLGSSKGYRNTTRKAAQWGTFSRKHKRLEQTGFEGIENFCLSHLCEPNQDYPTPKDMYPDRDWLVYAAVSKLTLVEHITLNWIPALIGGPSLGFFDLFKELVTIGKARYALRYQKKLNPRNLLTDPEDQTDPTTRDRGMNGCEWGPTPEQVDSLLLSGVYTHNYLSDAHLSAPFGRTAMSLREWIEDEPSERGVLRPYNDILTEWTPPPRNIPELRERLFRAGRIFYWRFNREWDSDRVLSYGEPFVGPVVLEPERFRRPDIHEPWESPVPIPEIFRAEYYRAWCADKHTGIVLE